MKSNIVNLYKKEYLLNHSKTFCILPWIHIYSTPIGDIGPCCISKNITGNTSEINILEAINSPEMKKLRVDMLNGQFNSTCDTCYKHDSEGIGSSRQGHNKTYEKYFNEVIQNTHNDGHLDNFKMRYFDIRFNNICNFKCRTCGAAFSSQWEQEDLKRKLPFAKIYPKNNKKQLLDEIINHISHIDCAYFAGGEPLITEEHYILLEEMIRQNRTDIQLIYNSNISNLTFKGRDVIKIWNQFKKPIEMYASIDHIKERAEYIRHGTNWNVIENNLNFLKKHENIKLSVNTVCNIFNYATLDEFYNYFIDNQFFNSSSNTWSLYCMSSPEHLTSQVLPSNIKEIANFKIHHLIYKMKNLNFSDVQMNNIQNAITWTNAISTWSIWKDSFQKEILDIDKFRGEDFKKIFPELQSLLD